MDDLLRDVRQVLRALFAGSKQNGAGIDASFWAPPETGYSLGREHLQNNQNFEDVGLREINAFHNAIVFGLQSLKIRQGGRAITEVPVTSFNGVPARADLLIWRAGEAHPFFCEAKTGIDPVLRFGQRYVYPLIGIGGHVYSRDFRIGQFGLVPGALLPPLGVFLVYVAGPGVDPVGTWIVALIDQMGQLSVPISLDACIRP